MDPEVQLVLGCCGLGLIVSYGLYRLARRAAEDAADIEDDRRSEREPGTIPWDKIKRDLDL